MQIFLLIVVLFQANVMFVGGNPTYQKIVNSPEQAAVDLWVQNNTADMFQHYKGSLYKVDIEKKTVIKVPIPTVKFIDNYLQNKSTNNVCNPTQEE